MALPGLTFGCERRPRATVLSVIGMTHVGRVPRHAPDPARLPQGRRDGRTPGGEILRLRRGSRAALRNTGLQTRLVFPGRHTDAIPHSDWQPIPTSYEGTVGTAMVGVSNFVIAQPPKPESGLHPPELRPEGLGLIRSRGRSTGSRRGARSSRSGRRPSTRGGSDAMRTAIHRSR
jgi:hypothetical protein